MKRPLAYITAPWGADEMENTEDAAQYCRKIYDAGFSPICPVLFLPLFLNDAIPQEHKDGIDIACNFLRRAHVLVVCGRNVDETVKSGIATTGASVYHRHHAGRHPHRQGTGLLHGKGGEKWIRY